jgi:hypothetical protein
LFIPCLQEFDRHQYILAKEKTMMCIDHKE